MGEGEGEGGGGGEGWDFSEPQDATIAVSSMSLLYTLQS